jgi:hypothetical protein
MVGTDLHLCSGGAQVDVHSGHLYTYDELHLDLIGLPLKETLVVYTGLDSEGTI